MANKKRRCTNCKSYKEAISGLLVPAGFFCDSKCAYEYGTKNTKKLLDKSKKDSQAKQKQRDKTKKERLKTASDYIKEAQVAVNKYIRIRDKYKPCVSCDNNREHKIALSGHRYDAGHYRSRGAASHLRFNVLNIRKQCVRCNRELSGNVVEFRKGLIAWLGADRVEQLENDNAPKKFTVDYLKRIKSIFTKKYKLYEKVFR